MKNSWIIYLAATFLWGANALAQTPPQSEPRSDAPAQTSQAEETSSPALSSADRKFVQQAAEGGVAEVEAGKLAQQNGQSDQVKEIGATLVEDHTQANQELTQIASQLGIDLPEQVSRKKQNALSKLEQASSEEFDRLFLRQQERTHRQSIERFDHVAAQSENDAIKQFAAKTLPTLRKHLEIIQQASGDSAPASGGASQQ
jgi:putative membrane protein